MHFCFIGRNKISIWPYSYLALWIAGHGYIPLLGVLGQFTNEKGRLSTNRGSIGGFGIARTDAAAYRTYDILRLMATSTTASS